MKRIYFLPILFSMGVLSGCGSALQSVSPSPQTNANGQIGTSSTTPAGLDGTWKVTNITCNGVTPNLAMQAFMLPNETTFSFASGTLTRTDIRSSCSRISTYSLSIISGNQFTAQQRSADTFNPLNCSQYWQSTAFDATKAPTETYSYLLNGTILSLTDSGTQDCASVGGTGQMQSTLIRIQ
jgi:uncharacterized cupin superfamily protein